MAQIIMYNDSCEISNFQDRDISRRLDLALSYIVPGHEFMKAQKRNGWDGRSRLYNKKTGRFPIGLLDMVLKVLKDAHEPYKIFDKRIKPNYGPPIKAPKDSPFKSRDYQSRVINNCLKEGKGVIRACTGAGKSYVLSTLTATYNVKTIIYVVSIDLLHQMKETLKESYDIDAGMVGGGHVDLKDVTIMTIWSASLALGKKISATNTGYKKDKIDKCHYASVKKAIFEAEMTIFDECHIGTSVTTKLANFSGNAYHRYMFSGTPWRQDSAENILIQSIAGKQIVEVSASELIEKKYLVQPFITFKHMPAQRGMGTSYAEVYKNYIIENDFRNHFIANAAKKLEEANRTTLIIYNKIQHGKNIKEFLDDMGVENILLSGSNSAKVRAEGIRKIKADEVRTILASSIFDQGVNIPKLDSLIAAGGGKATSRVLQRIGRVIRTYPGKENALVLDFVDNCRYLRDHSKVRMDTCRLEPGYKIREAK